ncbi:MAG TPA: tyrosine--tRNA ligase [Cytophagales bacterium]|nr:tyrosine--tRNA ligase [Cytophagales bacterium]HAA21167.1 tyrosine--tRNA ligase [Cytophagales bacterium]HAP60687.1 tyrosine--tRNA ligase [Cytophagales bacterium]
MKTFIEELRWRGMIHDVMPGTEEQLAKEMTSAYIGFDPTADSLHIGNLATIMNLVMLQRTGHKPYALVGGATGMVGDPSGKSEERNLLDEDTLRHNQESIRKQLEKFLDFESGNNKAVMVNNYDWMSQFDFLGFLRDVGKHITVSYMMAKDSVKNRMDKGISFTEFSYQLVQGYDFYHLYKEFGVRLQMGGSDQWGNITTGTELIRRMGQGEAFALTSPLVTKADGSKFGKSEGGNVWLDPNRTSPYKFYQFWMNVRDEEASKLLRRFTLLDEAKVLELEAEHAEAPHLRAMQQALAQEVTTMVHSADEYAMAVKASKILFSKSATQELATLPERTLLEVFEGVPMAEISRDALGAQANVTDLLSEGTGKIIFPSKSEAKRMIQGGGVSVNKQKLTSPDQAVDFELLQGKYLVVQRGKKNQFLVRVQ